MKDTDPVDLTDAELYDHWETVTIRYSDGDGMGHINNAVYAVWTEVARVTFTRTFMPSAPDWLDTVLVRQTMNVLKETQLPGEIRVGARLLVIGNTSYEFIADHYQRPVVIAGFEPLDILQSIWMVLKQIAEGRNIIVPHSVKQLVHRLRYSLGFRGLRTKGFGTREDQ